MYVLYSFPNSHVSIQAQDTDHENLARAIFDELNDAYSRFEESGSQALF